MGVLSVKVRKTCFSSKDKKTGESKMVFTRKPAGVTIRFDDLHPGLTLGQKIYIGKGRVVSGFLIPDKYVKDTIQEGTKICYTMRTETWSITNPHKPLRYRSGIHKFNEKVVCPNRDKESSMGEREFLRKHPALAKQCIGIANNAISNGVEDTPKETKEPAEQCDDAFAAMGFF